MERILDRPNPKLSDEECLEIYQIQQQINAILKRCRGGEKFLSDRVHFILQQSQTSQEKDTNY